MSPAPIRPAVAVVVALAGTAWAQTEPPPPPRIQDGAPGEAILARLPEDREEILEEIVVIGEDRWRLPDLGATLRLENEEPEESRLAVRFLPLYDPDVGTLNAQLELDADSPDRVAIEGGFQINALALASERIAAEPIEDINVSVRGQGAWLPNERRLEVAGAKIRMNEAQAFIEGELERTMRA